MATTLAKKKDNKHTDDRWGRKLLRLGENIKDGKIKTFTEAFDLVTESRLSTVTGISFYAFKKTLFFTSYNYFSKHFCAGRKKQIY